VGEQPPDFLFVCDHGVRGGQLDPVARLPWLADRPGWWAAEGEDEDAIRLFAMEGSQRGWTRSIVEPPPAQDDPRRFAIEIICPQRRNGRCSRRSYRSDDDKLLALLTTIATDEKYRTMFTVSADEQLIVMTLDALQYAHQQTRP
jgi:hypothetical protein